MKKVFILLSLYLLFNSLVLSIGPPFDTVEPSVGSISYTISNLQPNIFSIIGLRSGKVYQGIKNKNVKIKSLNIMITISDFGAVYLSESKLAVTSSLFSSNAAHGDGAAILATDNSDIIIDTNTTFRSNKRFVKLNSVLSTQPNDVALRSHSTGKVFLSSSSSSSSSSSPTGNTALLSTCDDTSMLLDSSMNSVCTKILAPTARANLSRCGDGICDPATEDFFGCRVDCNSVSFSGFLHTEYACPASNMSNCQSTSSPLTDYRISPFKHQDGLLKGSLETYFNVKQNGKIYFRFVSSNLDLKVLLDNSSVVDYHAPVSPFQSYDVYHDFQSIDEEEKQQKELIAYSGRRFLSVEYSMHNTNNFQPLNINYYSFNVCGDGIFSANETDCQSDLFAYGSLQNLFLKEKYNKTMNTLNTTTCGNGICDEADPNNCLFDCFKYITETCPPMTVRKGSIVPNEVSPSDTLGILIDNQMVWRLPGYQHFTYGYDIVYGEQRAFPIFQFAFCDDKDSNILEDVYRMMFNEVPRELSVTPLPRCTFNVETKFFSNTSSMKFDMYSKSAYTASANANVGVAGISAEVEASYSKEKSVKTSMQLESKISGTVVESTVNCFIYNVELNDNITFSLNFLKDIRVALTIEDFYEL
eukprot:gene14216-16767_t